MRRSEPVERTARACAPNRSRTSRGRRGPLPRRLAGRARGGRRGPALAPFMYPRQGEPPRLQLDRDPTAQQAPVCRPGVDLGRHEPTLRGDADRQQPGAGQNRGDEITCLPDGQHPRLAPTSHRCRDPGLRPTVADHHAQPGRVGRRDQDRVGNRCTQLRSGSTNAFRSKKGYAPGRSPIGLTDRMRPMSRRA